MLIELMKIEDANDIYNFELNNKAYFESVLPARPEGYFERENFHRLMDELIEEQAEGLTYMHLIRDETGQMIGRINLHRSPTTPAIKMELGYRIGQVFQGQGVASQAVKEIIKIAKDTYGLREIEAGTATDNIGSRRVLEKNGFQVIGEEKKVIKVQGKWLDGVLYHLNMLSF